MTNDILVTGSRGYIGSVLAKTLMEKGYNPHGVDKTSVGEGLIYGNFIQDDFASLAVVNYCIYHNIKTICHLAADASVPDSVVNPSKYFNNNVASLIILLDNLVKRGWRGNFIFSSSAAVYQPPIDGLLAETDPTLPCNPYGLSKLIGEDVLREYQKAYGFNVACFRYFNVAGAWDDVGDHSLCDHVIQKMINAALINQPFTIFDDTKQTPDGTCVRDYLHVRDVCDAHLSVNDYFNKLPDGKKEFQIFNLGVGQGVSVKQLVNSFERVTGKQLQTIIGQGRPGDPDFLVADGSRITRVTDHTYKHSQLDNIILTACKFGGVL